MNLRTIPILKLCSMWCDTPTDEIWDEVNRRTDGDLPGVVEGPKGLLWDPCIYEGVKIIRLVRPGQSRVAIRYPSVILDTRFIESLPEEDNLAFEPSAELDQLSIYSR